MPGKSAKGKRGGKGRRGAKGRRPARRNNMQTPEMASLSVTRTFTPTAGGNFLTNNPYSLENISLSQFDRAVNVAKAYQFYRISGCKLTIKVPFDTYQIAVITNNSYTKPDLYYMIDKAGVLGAATTLEQLKQMGARPRACDNKPTSISWRPSVLTETDTLAGAMASQYKISPWLNTSSQTVFHRGVFWFMDQLFSSVPATNQPYTCELEVQFQFKKPLWQQAPPVPPFQTLLDGCKPAELDGSTDGIVDHRNIGLSSEIVLA